MITHIGIANATKTPEIALDKEECDLLAESTANVMAQFDIRPDPKTEAIVGLVIACGSVYGPRIALINMKRKEKRENEEEQMAEVYTSDGRYTGETAYKEVVDPVEPANNAGTI